MPGHTNTTFTDQQVLRVIDVNLNRLREALRVIEEYFRFLSADAGRAASAKALRHSLDAVEAAIGREKLLAGRDIASDPFAYVNKPEELSRRNAGDVLRANFKRGQEAARALEEYAKVSSAPACSEVAKQVRFSLYALEKELSE